MTALLVVTYKQAQRLIAKAIAKKIDSTKKRVYISYGTTNQFILNELGIDVDGYYNGYISDGELKSNKNRPDIVILNYKENFATYKEEISIDDIIIKGANALVYDEGRYRAAVAVASKEAGTYADVVLKASCIGAKVLIPVSHEKLVPKLLNGIYTQNSFDISMGLPIALFEFNYGEIFTEIEAFKELYNLDAKLYISGGAGVDKASFTFVVKGDENSILDAKLYLQNTL